MFQFTCDPSSLEQLYYGVITALKRTRTKSFDPFARHRMVKLKRGCMQHQATGHEECLIRCIQVTTQNGMTDFSAVYPQLMGASRLGLEQHACPSRMVQSLDNFVVCRCAFARVMTDFL